MATNKIAIRQDTAANLTSANPTLDDGELGHESDTGRTKIGDGSTAWNSLNYIDTLPRGATQIDDGDSPYTILQTDLVIYVDASGGAVTVTLPALSGNLGRKITVRAQDATNTITVARAGSDTIANALTSVTLSSDRDYWTLEAGPDQWELVAGYETISGTNDGIKRFDGTMEQWGWDYKVGGTATSLIHSTVTYAVAYNSIGAVTATSTGIKATSSGVPTSALDSSGGSYENSSYVDNYGSTPTTGFRPISVAHNGETHRNTYYYLISWSATGRWY